MWFRPPGHPTTSQRALNVGLNPITASKHPLVLSQDHNRLKATGVAGVRETALTSDLHPNASTVAHKRKKYFKRTTTCCSGSSHQLTAFHLKSEQSQTSESPGGLLHHMRVNMWTKYRATVFCFLIERKAPFVQGALSTFRRRYA